MRILTINYLYIYFVIQSIIIINAWNICRKFVLALLITQHNFRIILIWVYRLFKFLNFIRVLLGFLWIKFIRHHKNIGTKFIISCSCGHIKISKFVWTQLFFTNNWTFKFYENHTNHVFLLIVFRLCSFKIYWNNFNWTSLRILFRQQWFINIQIELPIICATAFPTLSIHRSSFISCVLFYSFYLIIIVCGIEAGIRGVVLRPVAVTVFSTIVVCTTNSILTDIIKTIRILQ